MDGSPDGEYRGVVSSLGDDALDFWLGDWSVSWPGGTGTNSIRRILDGKVIEETFECRDSDGSVLLGRSLSVRDSADGTWRQTWVDSSGAYLDLVGVESDEGIAFQRTTAEGARQRMVWLNVTADTLRWEWQRSEGDGDKWTVMWPLDYRRLR
jgi:hypothetical protein